MEYNYGKGYTLRRGRKGYMKSGEGERVKGGRKDR
jgi:hypothetical protein